jgi:hypothetical protein
LMLLLCFGLQFCFLVVTSRASRIPSSSSMMSDDDSDNELFFICWPADRVKPRMLMNTALERTWKETVLAFFKAVSWHLRGGTGQNNRNLCLDKM